MIVVNVVKWASADARPQCAIAAVGQKHVAARRHAAVAIAVRAAVAASQ